VTPREWLGTVLFRLRLREVLPGAAVNRIPALDNGELLVPIEERSRLVLRPFSQDSRMWARASAAARLYRAVAALPEEYQLIVVDAYRTVEYQQSRWAARVAEISARMPGAPIERIEGEARRFTARPRKGGSGHQAGAAFDVTLADSVGTELDMGCPIKVASAVSSTRYRDVSRDVRHRRELLRSVMVEAGFVNYPLEWWHFSYGDRMWAAYTRRAQALFEIVEAAAIQRDGGRTEGRVTPDNNRRG